MSVLTHVIQVRPSFCQLAERTVFRKPFVKRQKNHSADAEAIVEIALRPSTSAIGPRTMARGIKAEGEGEGSHPLRHLP